MKSESTCILQTLPHDYEWELNMRPDYKKWLEDQKYSAGTITAQMHRVGRIEDCYGDLEKLGQSNRLSEVLAELAYSTDDERRNRPNPSKIPFQGKIRTNIASYKDALKRYQIFLNGNAPEEITGKAEVSTNLPDESLRIVSADIVSQKLSLERDLQAALRQNINQLSQSFSIVDDGAEHSVESGFIDILCKDNEDGAFVVIELKAGKTDSRVIGQVLGYMGDLSQEEQERKIKGIVVAQEFDRRTISASRAVPNVKLVRYSVSFKFNELD